MTASKSTWEVAEEKGRELAAAKADLAWWQKIFEPLGYKINGWSYRNSASVISPAGDYISVDSKILELVAAARAAGPDANKTGKHSLDTDAAVYFYEQDFYVLSNFSSFAIEYACPQRGRLLLQTAEHLYHWLKFPDHPDIQNKIWWARSAHLAFQIAQENRDKRRPDWNSVKVREMREILRMKVEQHEYVYRKLMQTGDRLLIENSWRDDYWGWGENRDGLNVLGRLWMEVRDALRDGLWQVPWQKSST